MALFNIQRIELLTDRQRLQTEVGFDHDHALGKTLFFKNSALFGNHETQKARTAKACNQKIGFNGAKSDSTSAERNKCMTINSK